MNRLTIVPVTRAEAFAYIERVHRHHKAPVSSILQLAVARGDEVVGVAIVGRPVARMSADGWTAEVTRVATNGTKNACSKLYGAAWRAARALGYRRLITFTLPEEGGVSLKASGWSCLGKAGGGSWSRKNRPRVDLHPLQVKMKWEKRA